MRFVLSLILGGCAVCASGQSLCVESEEHLFASDLNDGALFGIHVDVDGETMVVGASNSSATVANGGAAYLFERVAGVWSAFQILESDDLSDDDFLGYSVSLDHDWVVAGAWGEDSGGLLTGAAYVFERDLGGADLWGQRAKLLAPERSGGDLFGFDVSIDHETIAVSAPLYNGTELDQGAVYLFDWDQANSAWEWTATLVAPDPFPDAQFGTGISIDGDTLIVGAIGDPERGVFSGAAYVYERDLGGADQWGLSTKLLADTGGTNDQSNDQFGFEVDINGDRLVVGAIRRDLAGVSSGAAYVFERDEGGAENWGQVHELLPSNAQSGQHFGNSVSVSGDRIAVGSVHLDTPATQAGGAYVFVRQGDGTWVEELEVESEKADVLFGSSVVLDGDTLAVGIREDVIDLDVVGSVTVYGVGVCTSCVPDITGDGILDIFDVFAFLEAFNASEPIADFSGDGIFDIFDVFGFIELYNLGCS